MQGFALNEVHTVQHPTYFIGIKEPKELHLDEINTYTLGKSSIELWSYYLLTRTRELIDFLFKERVKKFPPDFM